MKYFTKKIIAVLLTVMLTGITVLHVSGDQTIKVNAAQTFKIHFIDVGAADGALLQYGEGENAKYALVDSGAYSYETTDHDTIDVSDIQEETREEEFIQRRIIAYPICCATGRNIHKIRGSGNDFLWSVRQYL